MALNDMLAKLGGQGGQTPEQASARIAQVLPEMVNQATPQGQMPREDPFSKALPH
ncbi:MAG TPA: YidB family protein [Streptosporangiaceae bacterium]|nr:YidB family protein [Streptosporangiaceae bacterium]